MDFVIQVFREVLYFLKESSVFILFGMGVAGLLKAFLPPGVVSRHLGKGRFMSVFKASLIGIPIPLCSCGVLPAAATLKKQGANNGATVSFLISTPESGVDSIALTYALMGPVMTIARPLSAFITASAAGILENLRNKSFSGSPVSPDMSCPVDGCCDGGDCSAEEHASHHTGMEKIRFGMDYAFSELWNDMSGWFFSGILLAAVISVFIPEELMSRYLGGGLPAMLMMLAVGIPIYICATASTPVAAALILKGVSPGAALVFLLVGPATNITSLSVLTGLLGKKATALYLLVVSAVSVVLGLLLDAVYIAGGLSAGVLAGEAVEIIPSPVKWAAVILLLMLTVRPMQSRIRRWTGSRAGVPQNPEKADTGLSRSHGSTSGAPLFPVVQDRGCGCGSDSCSPKGL